MINIGLEIIINIMYNNNSNKPNIVPTLDTSRRIVTIGIRIINPRPIPKYFNKLKRVTSEILSKYFDINLEASKYIIYTTKSNVIKLIIKLKITLNKLLEELLTYLL